MQSVRLTSFAVIIAALAPAARAQQPAVPEPPARGASTSGPTLAAIAPREVRVGDSLRVPLVVDDAPPGADLQLRLDAAPPSARIEGLALRWRPLRTDAGASYDMLVHVMAGTSEVARGTVHVSVVDAHRPPVMRPPGDRVLPPGDSLVMPVETSDPDGDPLTVSATNLTDPSLPPRYDAATGSLTWQAPRGAANRVHVWRVTVSDGDGGSAASEVRVAVRSQNVAPTCGPMRTYKLDEGESVDIALDADDANGDSLHYQPTATLPNGVLRGATYHWTIPYGFVLPSRQDSTVRFEWRATDAYQAQTNGPCVALVTVFRSIAEAPFRARQAQHRQLVADVRSELENYVVRERATRDSVSTLTGKRRSVKRASLASALVGGLLQIARSEDTRRIAAGVSATLTVGLSGWEATLDDGAPVATRAETLAQQRVALQRALSRFLRKYGETVSREALLGPTYDADHLELFDQLAATGRVGSSAPAALPLTEP